MSNAYVESGYVDPSYFLGASIVGGDGSLRIKFYIAKGDVDLSDTAERISSELNDDECCFLMIPDAGKSCFVGNGGFSLLGGDLTEIIQRVDKIENTMQQNINPDISVSMVAKDGTVLATPEITKDGADYVFSVPENVSSAGYDVVLTVSPCTEC